MRKVLVFLSCLLVSCGQPVQYYAQPAPVVVQQQVAPQQQYTIIQDPNTGLQNAVFYDNGVQMMVELSIFNGWMSNGGYPYVINHYHSYAPCVRYNSGTYSRWRTVSSGTYNSYKPSNFRATGGGATFRPVTNTPKPVFRNTTAPTSTFRPSTFRPSSSSPRPSSGSSFRRTH